MSEPTWIIMQWDNAKNHPVTVLSDHNGQRVATIEYYVDRATGRDMTIEHAYLIAASKAMLTALSHLAKLARYGADTYRFRAMNATDEAAKAMIKEAEKWKKLYEIARAAIAKAEGKP